MRTARTLRTTRTVVGIGLTSRATRDDVQAGIEHACALAAIDPSIVDAYATLDARAGHEALAGLDRPLLVFSAGELDAVVDTAAGVQSSTGTYAATGTRNVAEAAALLGAGTHAKLHVPKQRCGSVTIAVAATDTESPR